MSTLSIVVYIRVKRKYRGDKRKEKKAGEREGTSGSKWGRGVTVVYAILFVQRLSVLGTDVVLGTVVESYSECMKIVRSRIIASHKLGNENINVSTDICVIYISLKSCFIAVSRQHNTAH